MKYQWITKVSSALLIVMLAVAALPIQTTRAAGGAPTRFYLQNAAAAVTTATRGAWDNTSGLVTRAMSTTKSGAIATVAVAETSNINNYDVLMLKFISEPIPAQTIAAGSTLNWVIGSQESNAAANNVFHVHAYVVSNDGTTLRGTLLNNNIDGGEWPTTAQGDAPSGAKSLTSVTAQANDRIVIEIGYQAQNNSTTSRTGTLWYGGTGGDLTVGGDETNLTGWFEFSQDLFPLNTTTAGVATAIAADSSEIDVSMPYVDDGNANNNYTVQYCLTSANCPVSGSWINWVTGASHTVSPYTTTINNLLAATSYDVRVTYNDADGVTGTNPRTITNVVTPACGSSYTYTAPAGNDRVVVVVVSEEGGNTPSNVQIGGAPAILIATAVNTSGNDARIYTGYRVIGTSAVPQSMNITATNGECFFAKTYENINQNAGTGASFTINSVATAIVNNGITTTSTEVFNAPSGVINNLAGGQVIYAINMNDGNADNQVPTGTSAVWGFSELFDRYASVDGNRTAVGEATTTVAGSATVSVADGTPAHNRSAMVAFALNPGLATPTLSITNSPVTYNGLQQAATVTCSSGGAVSNILYAGSPTVPTNAGTYAVTADCAAVPGFSALTNASAGNFVINPATPTASITNSPVTYNGLAQTATVACLGGGTATLASGGTGTNAGSYPATVNCAASANYTAATGLAAGNFVINPATPTASITNSPVTYNGLAQTATVACLGGGTATLASGGTGTNAGSYPATVNCAASANYTAATGLAAGNFVINPATPTASITNSPVTYNGLVQTATVACLGGGTATLASGGTGTDVGSYPATVDCAASANYAAATGLAAGNFVIDSGTPTASITNSPVTYNGLAQTATVACSGGGAATLASGGTGTNAGSYPATVDCAASANYAAAAGLSAGNFVIDPAPQTINVTMNAPASASNGSTFDVAATATSGLPVTITTSGSCSGGDTDGDATITMTSGSGTCTVSYNQAGDSNYAAAPQVQENVNATEGPSFTSANNTSFDMGFPGSFTVTAVGNPSTMTIISAGALPSGVTLTDNGDGTASLAGTPAAGTNGTYNLIFTADNGVAPNGLQNFTLIVRNGPIVAPNGVNSIPDTGNGSVSENESIIDTLGITQLTVEFSQDVYDPAGDTDPDDVTNPANYVLVRSATGTFATVSCAGGPVAPDITISVDSVTYDNGGGSGPFISTLSINGGLPLNVVGFYRLYVCGTTSIVDAVNPNLILAGNGTTPGTDFQRNFRIATQVAAGGGGGGASSASQTLVTSSFLIPVTGFAPNQVTTLPAQPADKAYTSMGQMTIEIPTLGIKFPIVGASITNKTWDLTWLKNSVAYLEGSAYPTTAGNTVLTAHVQDANKNLGPFSDIKGLEAGQYIYIHVNGQTYVYQVQENQKVLPTSISKIFKHEEDSWITLVTCEDYNAKTGLYSSRRMVRAVLISVIPAKK
ncbi:MAG: sortase [Anaerolineales bacterium]|nr:sortase [Anaerolineales bacterium]